MTTKSIAPWPPAHTPLVATMNNADALSTLVRRLSANAASMHAWVRAGDMLDADTPNPVPLSPSGQRGHDHSGGQWGRPDFRSVVSFSFTHFREVAGTFYSRRQSPNFASFDAVASLATHRRVLVTGAVRWVPPCDPVHGAYARMGVRVLARVTPVANMEATDLLGFHVRCVDAENEVTLELDAFDGGAANHHLFSSDPAERLTCKPARPNVFEFAVSLEPDHDLSSADRSVDVELLGVELGIYTL